MRKLKKVLSLTVALAMMLALVIQLPVQAELAEGGLASPEAGKLSIKLVALETDEGSDITDIGKYGYKVSPAQALNLANAAVDDPVMIGVQVSGIKNVKPANMDVGIYTFMVGIKFNTEVMKFDGAARNGNYTYTTVQNAIKKYLEQDGDYDSYIYKESENGLTYDLGGQYGTNVIDLDGGTNNGLGLVLTWNDGEENPTYLPNDGDLLVILPFKMVKNGSEVPAGTEVLSFSSNRAQYTLSFGNVTEENYYAYEVPAGKSGIDYEPDPANHKDILNVAEYDTTGVDFFPAGAPVKNGIKADGTKKEYVAGDTLDYGKVQYTTEQSEVYLELGAGDTVELYYGEAGKTTAADAKALSKIEDGKATADMDGKHLYIVVGDYVYDYGELTVSEVTVTELTKDGTIPQQYVNRAPKYDGITVTANYNNSTTADVTSSVTWKWAESTDISDAEDSGLNDLPDKWPDGTTRYLYAVYGGKIVEIGPFTPIAVTVTEIDAVNGTISGAVGDNVLAAADGVKATFTLNDGTQYTDVNVLDAIADSSGHPELADFGLYVRKGDSSGYTYTKVEAGTTLEKDMVIVITNSANSPVSDPISVTVDTSAIVSIEVTNTVTAIEGQHVTAVLDNAGANFKFTAKDAGGAATDYNLFDTYTEKGFKLQIKGTDGNWTDVTKDTKFALGTNTFKVVKGAVESDEFTINASGKKASSLTVSGAPTSATYGDTVDLSGVIVTITYDNGDTEQVPYDDFASKRLSVEFGGSALSADATYAAGTNTFTVKGPDGSTTTIEVTAGKKTVTLTATGTAEKTYDGTTALPVDAAITYSIDGLVGADSYTATADAAFASKNASDSATITISNPHVTESDFADKYILSTTTMPTLTGKINKADIKVTAITDELSMKEGKTATGEKEMALTDANSIGLISGDTVNLKYTWTFTDPNTVSDKAEVTISGTSLTGADGSNYNLAVAPATTTGKVVELSVTSIMATSGEYTYPNLVPTITVTGTTEDNQTINISLDDCTLTVDGEPFDITQLLPYGETVVTVDYEGITTTVTLKANRKTINIDDVVFDVTRTLGVATVNSATINAGVEDADKENVSVDLEGITATLSGMDAVLTNITLTGDAAENYVLSSDTKTVATTLVKANQDAPAAPQVTVDPKTNKFVAESVASPNGTAVQYFVNGEGPKTEEDLEAMELEQGKEYDVKVKYAGNDDYNESPDSSITVVTAHKYLVKLVAAKGGAEYASVYTDEVTVENSAALLTLLGVTAPRNVKTYYYIETVDGTDTQKSIENYAVNGDWTVYYTVSTVSNRGGGSGGGVAAAVSYTVSYSAGSHGSFAEGAKTRETVSINGKPSNVPSVTAEEGWTFAGWSTDGETIVDPTQVAITKNTTFTALYEKDGSVDVQPPAIDAEYTKPYAAGYPDGTFMPDNNITRAELAAMIARLSYGDDIPSSYVASFPDVAADAWYSKYIGYLEGLNVLTGYNDGTFQPENTITRAEVCAVIARAQKMSLLTYEDGLFSDVEADYWASQYIETLEANGIISGYADGSFGPASPITRAETVAIINRVLAPSTPIENVIPSDISGHWAENDIILAVNERQLTK